ncbi:MAG: hypothetical protein A2015_10460 [Spirochaetes bacterium GWF1_31_7]|nr:MAG: hypothetical protein A2Y30_16200 [Spirochaetes bacterium GWE1_32_154]OHD48521.1 MAG: hypothetical protein A2Y29_14175 [Spirochaetes bacterium GWE2_31_10]OHD51435.1 MAG: hypothetical protein A2015_10460 [Spirochaetes bacterium GWF1_31_7]HBD93350.1 hypothetical protein [Spirochaetia bacterium]HBI36681.1 hypothetical protein [Spirochaetia bacterium]
MKKEYITILILSSIIALLIGTIAFQQGIISSKNAEIQKVKYLNNKVNSDLEQIKVEYSNQIEIIKTKNELLDKAKNAKSFADYTKIWKELNK